jgi:O-acetyl-ADP-ribose deacetylase (regulator of RNase III)
VLASCYRRCLAVADALSVQSLAVPAIATGVYGFPLEEAAGIAVATIRDTPTTVRTVRLVAFDTETYAALTQALQSL